MTGRAAASIATASPTLAVELWVDEEGEVVAEECPSNFVSSGLDGFGLWETVTQAFKKLAAMTTKKNRLLHATHARPNCFLNFMDRSGMGGTLVFNV